MVVCVRSVPVRRSPREAMRSAMNCRKDEALAGLLRNAVSFSKEKGSPFFVSSAMKSSICAICADSLLLSWAASIHFTTW